MRDLGAQERATGPQRSPDFSGPYRGHTENRWPELERKLDLSVKVDDPWEMLGIDRDATRADIKKAYRTKLAGLHPDKVARMDPEIQDLARTRTVELREAYEIVLEDR